MGNLGMFYRGDKIPLYCIELLDNETGSVTVEIYHYNTSGQFVTDLSETPMVQKVAGEWAYNHIIAADADFTTYQAVYRAYDPERGKVTTDTFQVWEGAIVTPSGGGLYEVSGTTKNSGGAALSGVLCSAYLANDLSTKYGEDVSEANGAFTFNLDAGSYLFRYSKDGYDIQTSTATIIADDDLGDITLSASATLGSYCTVADIERELKRTGESYSFTSTTKPSYDDIVEFITDISIDIDARLTCLGFVTPVTATAARKLLRPIATWGAAHMAEENMFTSTGEKIKSDRGDKYEKGMDDIAKNPIKLMGAAKINGEYKAAMGVYNETDYTEPIFTVNTDVNLSVL